MRFVASPLHVRALKPLVLCAAIAGLSVACADYPEYTNAGAGLEGGAPAATGGRSPVSTGGTLNLAGETSTGGSPQPDYVCGNGDLEPGEICDDGETEDGDGCSADCTEQDPDYDCSNPGEPCVDTVICGNGVLEGDEVCDEGAENATEGCAPDCTAITDGWSCPRPGRPCVTIPECGNDLRERGEDCDDGNTDALDGCTGDCTVEDGYYCVPGEGCILLECGDGNRTPDEACDDGDQIAGDGCSGTCTVEPGFRCSSTGCKPICGDALVRGVEACDDGDRDSGDGCSSQCVVEPYYTCTAAEPSVCTSSVVCGNGVLEPGEVCDPGIAGSSACFATGAFACKDFDKDLVDPPVCGNGVIEYGEACDGDGGAGCTDTCALEDGFACPMAGYCYRIPECGDGIVQPGEECDVGAVSSVPCQGCVVQPDYYCTGTEPSVCVASACGDGTLAPDEQCDDGNTTATDGCHQCAVQTGWVCPAGRPCQPICGDGILRGSEECEFDGLGCTNCRVAAGYDCGTTGTDCHVTHCGDGPPAEAGEGCDDGNLIAGDGCGPTCQLEPNVTVGPNPSVAVTCGDGLVTGSEACDDGNIRDGDGCSSVCTVEAGWYCTDRVTYPDSLAIKVVHRDFKQRTESGGHPHMKVQGATPPQSGSDPGIVGPVCDTGNAGSCGRLDTQGKPVLATGTHNTIDNDAFDFAYHSAAFGLWYRDTNATNLRDINDLAAIQIDPTPDPMPAVGFDTILLSRVGATTAYEFERSSNDFYPLGDTESGTDPRGFGYTPNQTNTGVGSYDGENRNFHFTTELRYFFQYQGGETLTFFGDDDVWVFVNGRLAVDIGGIHGTLYGRVVLGDDGVGAAADSNCTVSNGASLPDCDLEAAETAASHTTDARFGLTEGNVYEIVLFQAERHPTGSNFRLTLDGFIAPRSNCQTHCGDELVAGTELCDEGRTGTAPNRNTTGTPVNQNGVYGACNLTCTFTFCGDGIQNGPEACDNGLNIDTYVATPTATSCAPGCTDPGYCGDGVVQSQSEVCDDGTNDGSYGGCMPGCQAFGGYCGDGIYQPASEGCDETQGLVSYGGCGFDCEPAPYCGDGIRNGTEQCDGTASCGTDCKFDPFCGDGLTDTAAGEQCDYGEFGFDGAAAEAPYGGCTTDCESGPYCGDGAIHPIEECDEGSANVDDEYDACTTDCTFGPRCGDAITQTIFGEACDNGYNEDTYAYVADACGPNCEATPYCGDGTVQPGFELCDEGDANDDDAYDGCTTECEWGPYCGDGVLQAGLEVCDLGPDNAAYSADGEGCGYDCQPAPFCGDGVRNGPEACDDGVDANTGVYGGCNVDCTRAPFCGDRIVQEDEGEECDDGPQGSLACSVECTVRDEIH